MEHELGFMDSRWVIETGSAAVRQSDERSFSFDDGERRRGLKNYFYRNFLAHPWSRIHGLISVTSAVKLSIDKVIMLTVLPVPYFLLAHPAGLFLCDDTFHLLVEDSLLLNLIIERVEHKIRLVGSSI